MHGEMDNVGCEKRSAGAFGTMEFEGEALDNLDVLDGGPQGSSKCRRVDRFAGLVDDLEVDELNTSTESSLESLRSLSEMHATVPMRKAARLAEAGIKKSSGTKRHGNVTLTNQAAVRSGSGRTTRSSARAQTGRK